MSAAPYAPGQRIIVRDTEWVIRRVDLLRDGGYRLECDGVSSFVKGKEAIFLSSYEKQITVIDPAKTKLVIDTSSAYERSMLYMESLLRELVPTDEKIYRAHKAAMDIVPYQFDPAIQALKQPRQRILMGDAVGLGKTLEAGILVSELIKRGRGKRILVLAVKSMLTQFQKEFWNRFSIPLTRLDSQGIQRVRNRIPANMNPFYYYDKAIISIDTLKQEALYRTYIEEAYWDIIVIDEAHNVADRNTGSLKSKLAKLVASRCDSLIMLSATPHDGSAKSFASLLNMLDPTAIADPNDYTLDDFKDKGLVIRRFKKDIADQVKEEFKPRKIFIEEGKAQASEVEEEAFALLSSMTLHAIDARKRRGSELFKTTLVKSLMSSPVACIATIDERLKKLENTEGDYGDDIDVLKTLKEVLENIGLDTFSKYQKLVELIKKRIRWKKAADDRLVIFTERLATMRFLAEHLQKDLKLKPDQVVTLHGAMPDVEINRIVEDFGQENAKVRLLIATDVASEGINLHYLSHRLFHFDIPWSLMVFQQRNGRIDRYGQEKEPEIYYMQTASRDPGFKGDNRILEILIEKDRQAAENIGDPSAFMNVYDPQEEEKITADAMMGGKDPDEFSRELDENAQASEFDFLSLLVESQEKAAEEKPEEVFVDLPTLYENDFAYATAALKHLKNNASEDFEVHYEEDRIRLTAPEDLRYRFKMLPREVWPKDGYFVLSPDRALIDKEIKESRKNEAAWPQIHYLWEQHPVMEWLRDKLLGNFDRLEAPVLPLPTLSNGETLFIVSGLIPNKRAQPRIHRWMGIRFESGRFKEVLSWEKVVEHTRLGRERFPNKARPFDTAPVEALLPAAIEAARGEMLAAHKAFEAEMDEKLQQHLDELEKLKARHMKRYGLFHEDLETTKEGRRIKKIFDDYWTWLEETMLLEREPYIQVVAALTGDAS